MKMKNHWLILLVLPLVLAADIKQSESTSGSEQNDKLRERIAQKLEKAIPNLSVESATQIGKSALYEVVLNSGETVYMTEDGAYLLAGTLFHLDQNKLVNLTADKAKAQRMKTLNTLREQDMVVFKAKGKAKSVITVFTDIDCGYCRKLHQEVPKLNEIGVTVRYLAFPRAGVYTDSSNRFLTASFKKIKSVWCDPNPQEAMTRAKTTGHVKDNLDCDAPIEAQLRLGQQLAVAGTPAIVLENGEILPGYRSAEEIAAQLGLK